MTKEYRISIAVNVPTNYEIRLAAESPEEARRLAVKAWQNDEGEFDAHADYNYPELAVDEDSFEAGEATTGVYVAEIDAITNEETQV